MEEPLLPAIFCLLSTVTLDLSQYTMNVGKAIASMICVPGQQNLAQQCSDKHLFKISGKRKSMSTVVRNQDGSNRISKGASEILLMVLVQCSDPGISAVPINIPADTVKLRLEKTLISRVPRAAFYNLSELRFLWLTYNSITSIHSSSFVNLKALRELRLDGNLLTAFPWEGLRDMPRLQTLGLHNNHLSILPAHAALFLPNITYLDLSSNSRSLGQSGMLLTKAQQSRCMRPSVQPAATRVISPLGSNVILRCDATGYPTPTLTWIKTSANTDCCQQDIHDNSEQLPRDLEIFMQESPQVGVRWSIISLNGLSYKDAGEYRCKARNMAGISEALIQLKVVGVTRLPRLPKAKSQKTSPKPPSKHRKPPLFSQ
ncbi:hypothetical protein PAMP_006428 [Pampus punctatissimus]